MGGGKSSTSSSQVQVPAEVLARYNSVNTRAEQAASTPFQSYSSDPNAFVAPLTGTQQSGIANTNSAAGMAQPFFTRGAQLTQAGAGSADPNAITGREIGQYFSPFMNSVFASQLAGQEQQNAQQRSGLQGEAIKSGAFGGDRAGIAAGNLAHQQNLANSQSNAQLLNSGFGTALSTAQQQQGVDLSARQADLARQLGAGAQIAQIGSGAQTAALTGANAQLTAGGQEQQTQQAGLSALYNQFLQQQGHPYQQAQFLANIAEGTGALSGSSTTSTQPTSFFSDERLKEDVEKIGKTFDGQNIIKFRYRGDPRMRIGLSAQEVERHHPEAVGESHGYRTVDYDAATEDAAERGHFQRGGMALGGGANDNVTKALEMLRSYGMEGSAGPYGITPRPRAQGQGLMTPKLPAPQKSEFQEGLQAVHSGVGAVKDIGAVGSAAKKLFDLSDEGDAPVDVGNWDLPGMRRGGGVKGYAIGGTPYGDEGYIPEPIEPPRSLPVAQPPSSSGGGGGASDLASIASLAKIAAMFLKDGGAVERRHRESGGELVDAGTWDLPERPSRGVDAVLSNLRAAPPTQSFGDAISGIESRGRYDALGPEVRRNDGTTDRAHGKYQVMGSNIGPWTEAALGRRMTPDEFRADPTAQDQTFKHRFGSYVTETGSPEQAAAKWFSGRTLTPETAGIADQNGTTVGSYVDKFRRAIGLGGTDRPPIPTSADEAPSVATPRKAAAGEKSSPNWVERNQDWLVPVLSGLGGMAASPSRFLAGAVLQGLGTGAQSYENVQNQVAQRERLGEETAAIPKRVAVSERTVGVSEAAKTLEVLTQLRQIAGGYAALGKDVPPNLRAQIAATVAKLTGAGVSPELAGAGKALVPGAPGAAVTPQAPSADAVPVPVAPTTDAPASPASAPTTESPAAPSGMKAQTFRALLDPENDPEALRARARNAVEFDPAAAKQLQDRALDLEKQMNATGKAIGRDGSVIEIPGWAEEKARQENVANNPPMFVKMAESANRRNAGRSSLTSLQKVLENYQTGSLNDVKAGFSAFSQAVGGPKLESPTMSAEDYQTAVKDAYKNIFEGLKDVGGRAPGVEIAGLEKAVPSPTLAPEANRRIIAQAVGALDYSDKFYRDAAEEYKRQPRMSLSEFQTKWEARPENKMSTFVDAAYRKTPVRGATPTDWTDATPGALYVLEPGFGPGITKPTKGVFVGLNKEGQPGFRFPKGAE